MTGELRVNVFLAAKSGMANQKYSVKNVLDPDHGQNLGIYRDGYGRTCFADFSIDVIDVTQPYGYLPNWAMALGIVVSATRAVRDLIDC